MREALRKVEVCREALRKLEADNRWLGQVKGTLRRQDGAASELPYRAALPQNEKAADPADAEKRKKDRREKSAKKPKPSDTATPSTSAPLLKKAKQEAQALHKEQREKFQRPDNSACPAPTVRSVSAADFELLQKLKASQEHLLGDQSLTLSRCSSMESLASSSSLKRKMTSPASTPKCKRRDGLDD